MIGCPEEQRSRSFASHAEQSIVIGSGWYIYDD